MAKLRRILAGVLTLLGLHDPEGPDVPVGSPGREWAVRLLGVVAVTVAALQVFWLAEGGARLAWSLVIFLLPANLVALRRWAGLPIEPDVAPGAAPRPGSYR